MAILCPNEGSPRKRLRLSISNRQLQLPIYTEHQTQAYIAQLPAHAQFHTEIYLPPQFHHPHNIPTYTPTLLNGPPQIPTPPDTPPTLSDSQFPAPSHPQYYTQTIPCGPISPPLHPVPLNDICRIERKSREREEVKEREEVRNMVLRDVQKAFGGEGNYNRFLACGSRTSMVLRWEVERLGMGG